MSKSKKAGGRVIPQYKGQWRLSDEQVDVLATHHTQLTAEVIQWLDHDFRLLPTKDAHWLMLGQHMVEFLQISDARAFQATCHGIVGSMRENTAGTHPFVAASITEAGMTEDDGFDEILEPYLGQNAYGLFSFATGFLNLGDPFSTLWSLRMLVLAGRAERYSEKVEKAIRGLEVGVGDIEKCADHLGFYLYVLVMLGREQDRPLIERYARTLIEDDEWQEVDHNLRQGGFVAYDLMFSSQLHPEGMSVAERWLEQAFSLSEAPTGPPKPFTQSRVKDEKPLPFDVWAQGYLRALVAAALYLRMRRPNHTPTSALVANGVRIQNQHAELGHFYLSTQKYLPGLDRMNFHKAELDIFWDRDANNFEKNVFISRWMGGRSDSGEPDPIAGAIAKAICDELKKVGLVGRYAGDRETPYSEKLWDNNEIYLRGCKYGISVFEGMSGEKDGMCGTNHNVLVESGFMWGKGANVLVVHDPSKSPGLPSDLNGILRGSFDRGDPELTGLRRAVRGWAEQIVEQNAKQEAKPENDQPENAEPENDETEN
jgi:hypothetical protein